jgi:hypothetical protein
MKMSYLAMSKSILITLVLLSVATVALSLVPVGSKKLNSTGPFLLALLIMILLILQALVGLYLLVNTILM